jgi:glycosyltransferase involved in cell wall biosynthesis
LIYVGALHQDRNLMSLCQAVEEANSNGLRFHLSLAGRGEGESALREFAQQTEGRVRVLSPVPHVEVPDLMAQAHVGVLPFPDEEKFRVSSPIKLFEYMGAGMPILATQIVCHTDVVGNGEYVFWAEDASVEGLLAALHQMWRGWTSLEKMGLRAAAAARDWTWQASARKLCRALERGLLDTSEGAPTQCL